MSLVFGTQYTQNPSFVLRMLNPDRAHVAPHMISSLKDSTPSTLASAEIAGTAESARA